MLRLKILTQRLTQRTNVTIPALKPFQMCIRGSYGIFFQRCGIYFFNVVNEASVLPE